MPNSSVRRRGPGRSPTLAIIGSLLTAFAGCQTARPPATYPAVGQQPAYGGWATQPQGAAYPPSPPMPGPAAQPVAQTWPQAPTTTMLPAAQPQPYNGPNSQSLTGQWQQMQNNAANQWQQMNTQAQQQAQQAYANAQQQVNQIPAQFNQQFNQQANQAMNQANQQMNQAFQAGQQQAQQGLNQANQQINQALQAGQQQVTAQMQPYPPQAPNTSWNPFSTPAVSQPPARATPVAVPRY